MIDPCGFVQLLSFSLSLYVYIKNTESNIKSVFTSYVNILYRPTQIQNPIQTLHSATMSH